MSAPVARGGRRHRGVRPFIHLSFTVNSRLVREAAVGRAVGVYVAEEERGAAHGLHLCIYKLMLTYIYVAEEEHGAAYGLDLQVSIKCKLSVNYVAEEERGAAHGLDLQGRPCRVGRASVRGKCPWQVSRRFTYTERPIAGKYVCPTPTGSELRYTKRVTSRRAPAYT